MCFSRLIAFLLILFYIGTHCAEIETENATSQGIVQNEFIVSFHKYKYHFEHQILLSKLLGTSGWEVLERNNPAWALPSDFSLIKVLNTEISFVSKLLQVLRNSNEIRHVVPERRFAERLNEIENMDTLPDDLSQEAFDLIHNQTGRRLTRDVQEDTSTHTGRRLHSQFQVPELFNAHFLWENKFTGTGVRVAIFDTGLRKQHPHFRNVREITNWTNEDSTDDGVGHGTFVAGVIASQSECLGFAPDSDLFIFRVFTNRRVSYTSWFLDAFNYAIHKRINILNLSIGGPDFMDRPFVEKVWELSANNIIVVSAIGNDGPLYGTLNNPADQLDVIGVGGIDFGEQLARFSSRGMTTWELPEGYGRVKPDIVAYGQSVQGSKIYSGCRALSGTSVASPVVAGAVALLASTVPESSRWDVVNPASIKQVLVGSAEPLPTPHIFEQGSGKLSVLGAYELLSSHEPHASAIPRALDLTNCPYMWPYCTQPLYHSAMPLMINMTVLNSMGVAGEFIGTPQFRPGTNGNFLEISYTHSDLLWPWTGWLGVHVQVAKEAAEWEGEAEGLIVFTIQSPAGEGEVSPRQSTVEVPLKVRVIPTPPRSRRLLWDQYHNLRYPSGYFPRDALDVKEEPFDWNGDHPHTNFQGLYRHLRSLGYFIEILGSPLTCFDASLYSALLIIDSEEEFFPVEIKKLKRDVEEDGLSLIVIADWYNVPVMKKIKFFDENTRQWWTPSTGGANIPALNDLLQGYHIALGDRIFHGEMNSADGDKATLFASGTSLLKFPKGGSLLSFPLLDKTQEILTGKIEKLSVPIAGMFPTDPQISSQRPNGTFSGKIVVFGDSSCLDDANNRNPNSPGDCFWMLEDFLTFVTHGKISQRLKWDSPLTEDFQSEPLELPRRMEGHDLHKYSKVIGQSAVCPWIDFGKTNRTQEVVKLEWEDLSTSPRGTNGKFREKLMSRTSSRYSQGAIWPYVAGFVLVSALIAAVIRWRRETEHYRRSQPV